MTLPFHAETDARLRFARLHIRFPDLSLPEINQFLPNEWSSVLYKDVMGSVS